MLIVQDAGFVSHVAERLVMLASDFCWWSDNAVVFLYILVPWYSWSAGHI